MAKRDKPRTQSGTGGNDPMTPWWAESEADIGASVVALGKKWWNEQSARRTLAAQGLYAYYARKFNRMSGSDVLQVTPEHDFALTPARSILDTAKAKIASTQRPKAVVLTTGAEYRTRVKAKKLSKWLLAMLYKQQGQWCNSWELGEQVFLDCMRWEAGVIKVLGDFETGDILHERVYPYDLLFDEYEAEHGAVKTIIHVYRYDRWNLAARFPKHRDNILRAAAFPDAGSANGGRNNDMIAVYEAWRLPIGKGQPGKWVISVDGPSGVPLVNRPWKHNTFPLAITRWTPQPYGFLGDPLIQQLIGLQDSLNALANDLHENVRLQSGGYVAYDPTKITDKADLETNLPFKLIETNGDPRVAIQVNTPPPFHPANMQFVEFLRGAHYEYTGVSEMAAMARKEPGIESGAAIRTVSNMQSERFMPQARAYEQLFVQIGRLDLLVAADLVEADVKVTAALPQHGGVDEIDFSDVRLPEETYLVTIQAASSTEDTLAGRRQIVSEMVQRGRLTGEEADELLASSNIDIESLSKRAQAQTRYIDKLMSKFQDFEAPAGEDEDEELLDGEEEIEEEDEKPSKRLSALEAVYEVPDPVLDLNRAIVQMSEGLVEMLADGAPEENRELVRRWITEADAIVAKRQAPAPQAPGPGGPPGGVPLPSPTEAGMPGPGLQMMPPVAA